METKKTILIADTSEEFRTVLAEAIQAEEGLEVVGQTGDGQEAIQLVQDRDPDVLVMDLVLERMDGLVILDDLDSDALGVYCVMMARYESQCKLLALAAKGRKEAKEDPEAVADAAAKLDAVSGKMQSLERNILQYAEKLGLTPSGRVRLAQKRAQAAADAAADPDGDLYGD